MIAGVGEHTFVSDQDMLGGVNGYPVAATTAGAFWFRWGSAEFITRENGGCYAAKRVPQYARPVLVLNDLPAVPTSPPKSCKSVLNRKDSVRAVGDLRTSYKIRTADSILYSFLPSEIGTNGTSYAIIAAPREITRWRRRWD
jgi:hypothetical protein